jgi:hypothetical protein
MRGGCCAISKEDVMETPKTSEKGGATRTPMKSDFDCLERIIIYR